MGIVVYGNNEVSEFSPGVKIFLNTELVLALPYLIWKICCNYLTSTRLNLIPGFGENILSMKE